MRLGVRAAVIDGGLVAGDVDVEDGIVASAGLSPPAPEGLAVPGFVDAHINGFAGVDFLGATRDGYARAGEAIAATGVVAYQPTFITSPPPDLRAALAELAAAGDPPGPLLLGAHLEGPFLSEAWPGAHDPADLLAPDLELMRDLVDAGPVGMVTLAPERDGALELVAWLAERGIVVSCGHSDADTEAARAAFDAGASAMTHVHNAHRRWRPREPGPAGIALVREDVTVMAIVDNVHLAPETALGAFRTAGARFCLVTDAIEATGLGDGRYRLGNRSVEVRDGAARLADGRLAGAVLTMDAAVRNLVALGADVVDAVAAASTAPARMLGRDDLGVLSVGGPAHLTVLDDRLEVRRTLVGGHELAAV
jgi:N-acetylglucosamine-6-phosphate deacetylase